MKGKDANSPGCATCDRTEADPCHQPLPARLPKNTLVGPHEVDLLGSAQGVRWPSWLALVSGFSPTRISEMTLRNRTGAERKKQTEGEECLSTFIVKSAYTVF